MIKTERYDKNGKRRPLRFPSQRQLWSGGGENIVSDALGSYVGTDEDGGEPEQDADDL